MVLTTLTPADFPMPDMGCPSWCDTDHAADWQQHVAVGLDTRRIPAEGGGFLEPANPLPIEQWCSLDYFSPLHQHQLATVPLSGGRSDREHARIELQSVPDETPSLYLDAQGDMTAEVARQLAAALVEAAARLEAAL